VQALGCRIEHRHTKMGTSNQADPQELARKQAQGNPYRADLSPLHTHTAAPHSVEPRETGAEPPLKQQPRGRTDPDKIAGKGEGGTGKRSRAKKERTFLPGSMRGGLVRTGARGTTTRRLPASFSSSTM
jgi:hypothetical protein